MFNATAGLGWGDTDIPTETRPNRMVQDLVQRLRDPDPHVAAQAAQSLFDLGVKGGYASTTATRNREEIGSMPGVFQGFAHLVQHGTDEGQGWACAALAQIAFDNADNCLAVVRTPGMLDGLRNVMARSTHDSKAAAALAVNNIAAFSEQASAIIVQADVLNINTASPAALLRVPCLRREHVAALCDHKDRTGGIRSWDDLATVRGLPQSVVEAIRTSRRPNLVLSEEPGLLEALKALCRAEHTDARTDAVGALNHISRSEQARPVLIAAGILREALAPALLSEYDSDEELDAIVARATMAIANLLAHAPDLDPESWRLAGPGSGGGALRAVAEAGGCGEDPMLSDQDVAFGAVGDHDSGVQPGGGGGAGMTRRRSIRDYILVCHPLGTGCDAVREQALGILVRCLRYALKGEKWVGITWGIFSVLHALRHLSVSDANKAVMTKVGLVQLLVQLMKDWHRQQGTMAFYRERPSAAGGSAVDGVAGGGGSSSSSSSSSSGGGSAGGLALGATGLLPAVAGGSGRGGVVIQPRELQISVHILSALASYPSAAWLMRAEGAVECLDGVSKADMVDAVWRTGAADGGVGGGSGAAGPSTVGGGGGGASAGPTVLDVSLWVLRDRHVALCMGQHARLGAESRLATLDPAVMRLIVDYTCGPGGLGVLAGCLAAVLRGLDDGGECMVSG